MEELPNEMLLQIMSDLDNKALLLASQVSRLYYWAAHKIAHDRYRKIFGHPPPDILPVSKILKSVNPVRRTRKLMELIKRVSFGITPHPHNTSYRKKIAQQVVFMGSGILRLDLHGIGDINVQGRPDIVIRIDMTPFDGILTFKDFVHILHTEVYQRYVLPLINGAPLLHALESSFLSGYPYYYDKVVEQEDRYVISITD